MSSPRLVFECYHVHDFRNDFGRETGDGATCVALDFKSGENVLELPDVIIQLFSNLIVRTITVQDVLVLAEASLNSGNVIRV